MIFDLIRDLHDTLDKMPAEHRSKHKLSLIQESLRLDAHFIDRHRSDYPQALFQSLWNRLTWHDSPNVGEYYSKGDCFWPNGVTPWESKSERLSALAEEWHQTKTYNTPGYSWIRSQRPMETPLGSSQQVVFVGHTASVTQVAHFHDGLRVISASEDKTIRIWDRVGGEEILCIGGHHEAVTGVAITTDDSRILSASSDGTIRIWRAESGDCLGTLRHSSGVICLALSNDNSLAAAGLADGSVCVWSLTDQLERSRFHTEHRIQDIVFSSDGKSLVIATTRYAYCHSVDSGELLFRQSGVRGKVSSISVGEEGQLAVSAGEQNSGVVIWAMSSGREVCRLLGHTENIAGVKLFDKSRRVVTCSFDQTIRIWDVASGKQLSVRWFPEVTNTLSVSFDGRFLLCGTSEGICRQFEIANDRVITKLQGEDRVIGNVALSTNGQFIATTTLFQPTVRVWNGGDGLLRHELYGHIGGLNLSLTVQFSPNGKQLLSKGEMGRDARLWNPDSGVPTVRFDPTLVLSNSRFSNDESLLVANVDNPEWSAQTRLEREVTPFVIDCRLGKPLPIDVASIDVDDPAQAMRDTQFHAQSTGQETMIRDRGGRVLAWFHLPLRNITSVRGGGRWAGSYETHLCLFAIDYPDMVPFPAQTRTTETRSVWESRFPVDEEERHFTNKYANSGAGSFDSVLKQVIQGDIETREKALRAFVGTDLNSSQREQLVAALVEVVRDSRMEPMTFALLGPLLGDYPEILPAAVEGLNADHFSRQLGCLTLIKGFGAAAKPYLDQLLDLLSTHPTSELADLIHAAVSDIGLDATIPVVVLVKALRWSNDRTRHEVCDILDQLIADEMSTGVVPEAALIGRLLPGLDGYSRKRITRLLGQIGPEVAFSVAQLLPQLDSQDQELRRATAYALSRMFPNQSKLYLAAAILCSERVDVRRAGAKELLASGANARLVHPIIVRAMDEERDVEVRATISEILASLSAEKVLAAPSGVDEISKNALDTANAAQPSRRADPDKAAAFNVLVREVRSLWETNRNSLPWWERLRCPPPPMESDDGTGARTADWRRGLAKYEEEWKKWHSSPMWLRCLASPPVFSLR